MDRGWHPFCVSGGLRKDLVDADLGGGIIKQRQAVFARYLNVTTGLVSQWERGE